MMSLLQPEPDGFTVKIMPKPSDVEGLADVLATQGFEPQLDDDVVVLANCPFDALADRHRRLVCGLNVSYVQGVADGLGCRGAEARLEPHAGRCCVTVHAPS